MSGTAPIGEQFWGDRYSRLPDALVYRVVHQALTGISTSSVGRPRGGKRHEAGSNRIRRTKSG
jgi:hypothetical protein